MDDVVIARALHVLGVVVWIGGVSMVTTIALPAIRRGDLGGDWRPIHRSSVPSAVAYSGSGPPA